LKIIRRLLAFGVRRPTLGILLILLAALSGAPNLGAQMSEAEKKRLFLQAREDIRPVSKPSPTATPRPKPKPAATPERPTPRQTPKPATPEPTPRRQATPPPEPEPTTPPSPPRTRQAPTSDSDDYILIPGEESTDEKKSTPPPPPAKPSSALPPGNPLTGLVLTPLPLPSKDAARDWPPAPPFA
jgi:hypothetical protein